MTNELSNFNKLLREIINRNEDKEDIYRHVSALVDIHVTDLYKNIARFMEEMEKKEQEKKR